MEKMVKIGIIGAGTWGSNHAKALGSLGALCCIYDADAVRAKELAGMHSVKAINSLDDMLKSDVDGVILATPASTHASLITKILRSGKPVLVEKPMVTSMDQALTVKNEMGADSKLAVGYIEMFNPAVISLIDCLKGKDKLSLTLFRIGPRPERISDVGIVFDTMIHDINISNKLLGPSHVSSAWTVRGSDKREVFVTATIEGRVGTAHLVSSWISNEKLRMGIGISSGTLVTSNFITQEAKCISEGREHITGGSKIDLLKSEDEAFIKYINGEGEFPGKIDDALVDTDVALKILEKADENK